MKNRVKELRDAKHLTQTGLALKVVLRNKLLVRLKERLEFQNWI